MIIFIATVSENAKFIDSLKHESRIILHPFFAFDSEEGKKILEHLKSEPNKYTNNWQTVLAKDIFCIEKSNLVIYDLDNLPEEGRYLSMAGTLNKPILGVSETLKATPVYFSGSIISVIKPKHVLAMLNFIEGNKSFIELPKIVEKKIEAKRESILPDTGMPT